MRFGNGGCIDNQSLSRVLKSILYQGDIIFVMNNGTFTVQLCGQVGRSLIISGYLFSF